MQQNSIRGYFQKSSPSRPDNSRPGQPDRQHPQSSSSSTYSSNGRHTNGRYRGSNRHRHGNKPLKQVADETKAELSELLVDMPAFDAMDSSLNSLRDLDPLNANDCPNFILPQGDPDAGKRGTRIRVYNMDSFDAALLLDPDYKVHTHLGISPAPASNLDNSVENYQGIVSDDSSQRDAGFSATLGKRLDDKDAMMIDGEGYDEAYNKSSEQKASSFSTTNNNLGPIDSTKQRIRRPVAVLNLASERSPGGGWQWGALAQEECLCYRSSLYLSLHKSYYPIPSVSAIHTPNVVLIRDAMSRGHTLLTTSEHPENLPVTSVISVAALRRPQLSDDRKTFHNAGQRSETKCKIRLTIRLAASKGHTKLVLGALGCGVFANPRREVAQCFLEVLREQEFQGGWWEEIAFAVLDKEDAKDGHGNFGVFYQVLDGQVV